MKYKICMFCACFPLLTFAQIDSWTDALDEEIMKERERRNPIVTLYEFGQQITSCECNFDNLFRNWKMRFITNYYETRLLSYEYVETVTDSIRLNYYTDLKVNDTVLIHAVGSDRYSYPDYKKSYSHQMENVCVQLTYALRMFNTNTIGDEMQREIFFLPDSLKEKSLDKNYIETLKRERVKETRRIHIEDKIYLIKTQIKGRFYDHYVICNSQNNRIIWDDLFDFKMNVSDIRLY